MKCIEWRKLNDGDERPLLSSLTEVDSYDYQCSSIQLFRDEHWNMVRVTHKDDGRVEWELEVAS